VTSSSTAPAAVVPTMPAQASEDSPEGAAAFVKYYVDVFNYAAATGDVEELTRLSSPDCSGCQSYIKLYKETYAAGGYFRGGDWTIGDLEIEESTQDLRVFAHLDAAQGTQSRSRESDPGVTAPEDAELIFLVARAGDTGRMNELSRSTE